MKNQISYEQLKKMSNKDLEELFVNPEQYDDDTLANAMDLLNEQTQIKEDDVIENTDTVKEIDFDYAEEKYYEEESFEEFIRRIMNQQSQNIRTIKNCVVFFTVLLVISLVMSVILPVWLTSHF